MAGRICAALTLAAMHGRVEAVRVLLKFGADRDAVLKPPPESRHSAVGGQTLPISELQGMNALHLAASRGHLAVVKVLLQAGMDRDSLSVRAHFPLTAMKSKLFLNLMFLQGRLQTACVIARDGGHADVVAVLDGSRGLETGSSTGLAVASVLCLACVVRGLWHRR